MAVAAVVVAWICMVLGRLELVVRLECQTYPLAVAVVEAHMCLAPPMGAVALMRTLAPPMPTPVGVGVNTEVAEEAEDTFCRTPRMLKKRQAAAMAGSVACESFGVVDGLSLLTRQMSDERNWVGHQAGERAAG